MDILWRDVKARLQGQLSKMNFKTWIEPIHCSGQFDKTLVLECPNNFFIRWVRDNYLRLIRQEIQNGEHSDIQIQFVESSGKRLVESSPQRQLLIPKVDTFPMYGRRLNSSFTFDRFVTGTSNQLAYSAALNICESKNSMANFVFFLAKTGLGKSHLSQAVSAKFHSEIPELKVHYLTAEDFLNEMVYAIKQKRMDEFKKRYRQDCDVLVLEEVHFLSGKGRTQDELSITLDSLVSENKRVVVTSNKLPREIGKIESSLRSRLNSGLIISIDYPDLETRKTIIRRKSNMLNLHLSGDIIDFIAHHIKDDVRLIESCLISMAAKSTMGKQPMDIDLARDVVNGLVDHRKNIGLGSIQKFVAENFGISIEEMKGRSRKQKFTIPRNIAIYFCRKYTENTVEGIGEAFRRNHATVLYAMKSLKGKMQKDRKLKVQVEFLEKRMQTFCIIESARKDLH